jgi:hypothetical protein
MYGVFLGLVRLSPDFMILRMDRAGFDRRELFHLARGLASRDNKRTSELGHYRPEQAGKPALSPPYSAC